MTNPSLSSTTYLDQQGTPYSLFVHSGAVNSLEQAAQERHQLPDQVIRSLLFRLNEDDFALVLVAGPRQIPWKRLRQHFKQRRLTMASPQDVFRITGYQVGAVSPFGLLDDIPIYIDDQITGDDLLSMGSGQRGTAIMMHASDLRKALPRATPLSIFG